MKILYKIPSRSRYEQLFALIASIQELSENPDYKILVSLDDDDLGEQPYEIKTQIEELKSDQISFVKGTSANKIDAVNRDINDYKYDWDILVVLSDDHVIQRKGFDTTIISFFERRFPNLDGCPNFWDGNRDDDLITLAVMGKKYYDRFKYVYHKDYCSLMCDNEMTEVAILLGKYAKYKECIIKHNHPSFNKNVPMDNLYRKNDIYWKQDYETFEARKSRLFDLPPKKVISFCLWGQDEKYLHGAIRNMELAKQLYPDYICAFYVDESVPVDILDILDQLGAEIYRYRGNIGWKLMMYRFQPIEHPLTSIMLSRDTDSRFSERERICVKEFEESDKLFHCIHDHPYHNLPILGGMFGVKKGILDNIGDLIKKNINTYPSKYQCDQHFLMDIIYPIVKNNMLVHQDYPFYAHPEYVPINHKRKNYEFIGSIYNKDDNRLEEFHEMLQKYIQANPKIEKNENSIK